MSEERLHQIVTDNWDKVLITLCVFIDWGITMAILEHTLQSSNNLYSPVVHIKHPEIRVEPFKNLLILKSLIMYMVVVEITKRIPERLRSERPDSGP